MSQESPGKSPPTPGYREKQPRDKDDARRPGARRPPDPDDGGLDREPEQDGRPDDT